MTTKQITVEVTEEDIEEGIGDDCRCCPIALAIRRAIPKSAVVVSSGPVWVWPPESERYKGLLPKVAERFVKDFDKGNPVSPIKFELKLRA